jgi:hypothetical protein
MLKADFSQKLLGIWWHLLRLLLKVVVLAKVHIHWIVWLQQVQAMEFFLSCSCPFENASKIKVWLPGSQFVSELLLSWSRSWSTSIHLRISPLSNLFLVNKSLTSRWRFLFIGDGRSRTKLARRWDVVSRDWGSNSFFFYVRFLSQRCLWSRYSSALLSQWWTLIISWYKGSFYWRALHWSTLFSHCRALISSWIMFSR